MEAATTQSTINTAAPLPLPSDYILPADKRPNLSQVLSLESIPIIDLKDGEEINGVSSPILVQQVSKACEEFGFFQIVNHGIPEELCERLMNVVTEFFELPPEDKKQFYTTDFTKPVRLFSYYLKNSEGQEKVTMWSESFAHPWDSIHELSHLLPVNPPHYREVFTEYAKEIGGLMDRLLSLISQGLGLEKDCLKKRLGENPNRRAQANYYPPCPEPELTLGLNVHTDVSALTVLRQSEGVTSLQVIKDGQWVAVDPIPNAFVINLGDQIQVMSNGKYKSVHHRVVTNKAKRRVASAMFYGPNEDTVIGPVEELLDGKNPPFYRKYRFAEFVEEFKRQEGTRRLVKEAFELKK